LEEHLYNKFLNNSCTKEELSALFHLFGTTDESLLKALITEELAKADPSSPTSKTEEDRLRFLHQQIKAKIRRRKSPIRSLVYKLCAAAAILLMVTTGILLFKQQEQPPLPQKKTITPGHFQATLTLANGKTVILTHAMTATLGKLGQTTVNVSPTGGVSYKGPAGDQAANTLNTLATGRGEQSPYPLTLSDGSKVWLNAASSISFPTQFTGSERVVTTQGEVYFEIAHDKTKPFKVISGRQKVTVLGTHFNVKAYDDEHTILTTLLEGSVKVNDLSSAATGLLTPGQQSTLDRNNGKLAIEKANIEEVIAWKNGFFMFNDQQITSIMKSISRWYDMDVQYQNFSNNTDRFGGTFSRSSNLADILNSLQSLGHIQFKIDHRKIIVTDH
jgi:ferric-dicitrate binding protein FerR (iron transport regulator)